MDATFLFDKVERQSSDAYRRLLGVEEREGRR